MKGEVRSAFVFKILLCLIVYLEGDCHMVVEHLKWD